MASKTKWTPGPWRVGGKVTPHPRRLYTIDFDDLTPAALAYADHIADARLIAAAPELYEACELAYASLTAAGIRGGLDAIVAALLKARGES